MSEASPDRIKMRKEEKEKVMNYKKIVPGRLAILLGTFPTKELQGYTKQMPTELHIIRELCCARNYIHIYREKLQKKPNIVREKLCEICRVLKLDYRYSSEGIYYTAMQDINEKLQREVSINSKILAEFTGLVGVDFRKLFGYKILPYDKFIQMEEIEQTQLPFGVYIDCFDKTSISYSSAFSSANTLMKCLARAGLLQSKNVLRDMFGDEGDEGEAGSNRGKAETPKDTYELFIDADNATFENIMTELPMLLESHKVTAINIYVDVTSSPLWETLQMVNVQRAEDRTLDEEKLTLKYISRICKDKSMVDSSIITDIMGKYYNTNAKTIPVIFSADSDYLILSNVKDLAIVYSVDRESISSRYLTELENSGHLAIPSYVQYDEEQLREIKNEIADRTVLALNQLNLNSIKRGTAKGDCFGGSYDLEEADLHKVIFYSRDKTRLDNKEIEKLVEQRNLSDVKSRYKKMDVKINRNGEEADGAK